MDGYEINKETIALIPISNNETKIIEVSNEFIIKKNIMKLIDYSCKYFGSSFEGRYNGTKNLIGVSHKAPIIIEESTSIIFLPTSSPRVDRCSWINLNYINKFYEHKNGTEVIFLNGKSYVFDISHLSFENQLLRATRLESVLRRRKDLVI